MEKGHIIFLNGTSSAGKSTLSWEIQGQSDEEYYWLSNDAFTDMPHNTYYERDAKGTFHKAIAMMYKAVLLYVDNGINVIIDHVMLDDDQDKELMECARYFQDVHVTFVFVRCPLEELKRRELARGDREIGNAEKQYLSLYPESLYGVIVDTHVSSTSDCAAMILSENARLLADSNAKTAFVKLLDESGKAN